MHTWKSIALAAAVAMTLSAYADDRTSTSAQSTTKSRADTRPGSSTSAMPDKPMSSSTSTRASDHAQGTTSAMTDPELQNLDNEKFFKLAAASGMKEVQAAELALRNSKNEQVKEFARDMISDHTKQNTQLTTLAAQNNVQLAKELPAKEKGDIDKLRAATGTTFDTAYTKQMKNDHQKAVALFQSCASSERIAADVRSFCKSNLGTLEEHHQAADDLDSRSRPTRAAEADE